MRPLVVAALALFPVVLSIAFASAVGPGRSISLPPAAETPAPFTPAPTSGSWGDLVLKGVLQEWTSEPLSFF